VKAIKDERDCFPADVSPPELLSNSLKDELKYPFPDYSEAKEYMKVTHYFELYLILIPF
jgi:hypothetical protein